MVDAAEPKAPATAEGAADEKKHDVQYDDETTKNAVSTSKTLHRHRHPSNGGFMCH